MGGNHMKISLDWINDYVDIKDVDLQWLINKFTITTAEIEEVKRIEDDVIIEIDNKSITNRPDLWCHYGMASEISAITERPLKDIDYIKEEQLGNCCEPILDIGIEDKIKCLRYSAIKLNNIKPHKSPELIERRITNCGLRSINIIVDLANYVMLDIGQPLHTFDERLADSIRISSINEPVKLKTLDSVERELPCGTLMICNKDKALAVAGIIGGSESAVSENTEGIILESATFEGTAVRKTAAAIGIRTDASTRYEKFLDTEITTVALGRFLKLLRLYQPQVVIASALYDNVINAVKPVTISIQHEYIETYLGNKIDKSVVLDILNRLQFIVKEDNGIYNIQVPSFRATKDITCKADIIEEILRVYGYDKIKGTPNKAVSSYVMKNAMKEMEYSIKDILVKKFSFNEVHSYNWYDSQWINNLGYESRDTIKIINSSVKQFEKLRSDMVPNLLKIIYDNRRNYEEIKIFEIGRVFTMKHGELTQPKHLTVAIYSSLEEEKAYSYIKGICSYILKTIKNIEVKYIVIKHSLIEKGLSINYNDKELGCIYTIPLSILKLYGGKHVINIIDINLELLNDVEKNEVKYKSVSKHPETYLDFSILTSIDMPYSEIERVVKEFINSLIIQTKYIGSYTGSNVPVNVKSTTIRMVIGRSDKTIKLEEINKINELFIEHLKENGMQLR
jgi:phenylalanyl-tRNA synthetase beta chain